MTSSKNDRIKQRNNARMDICKWESSKTKNCAKKKTMAKAGTLPESFYHQELKPTDSNEDT